MSKNIEIKEGKIQTELEQSKDCLAVTLDYERYQHLLDNGDLTDEQKQEALQLIWQLVCEFVSLGFNVHPMDETPAKCGKGSNIIERATLLPQSDVYSCDKNQDKNKKVIADPNLETAPKGVVE